MASGDQRGYQQLWKGPPTPAAVEESAPKLQELVPVVGYESTTFKEGYQAPPRREAASGAPQETLPVEHSLPRVTEEDVREALSRFVDQTCCYGAGAARNMRINDIVVRSATHYTLETFVEARSTAWAFQPFGGALVAEGGSAPLPWDVPVVSPKGEFEDAVVTVEVPRTSQLRICHRCSGVGRTRCEVCSGQGGVVCHRCNGTGHFRDVHHDRQACPLCNTSGMESCAACEGQGQVQCKVCSGLCQLKFFVRLTVTWSNHVGNNVSDTGPLPRELLLDAQGRTVYEVQGPRVSPIGHIPGDFVGPASSSLIAKHGASFAQHRVLQQRHRVRMVPVMQVYYTWRQREGSFHVYGFENRVHFPDYPQQCCCGCQIL